MDMMKIRDALMHVIKRYWVSLRMRWMEKNDWIYRLRPKCYAFKIHGDDKEYKKCKGTAKNIAKKKLDMMITIKY